MFVISAPVGAQDTSLTPTRAGGLGVRYLHVDSIDVGVGLRGVSRGVSLGTAAIHGGLDMALWRIDGVRDRLALVARATGDAALLERNDRPRVFVVYGGAGVRYKLDTEEGYATLRVGSRSVGTGDATERETELDLYAQRRFLRFPCSERSLLWGLGISRTLDDSPSMHIEPSLTFDLGAPPSGSGTKQMSGIIELTPSWSLADGSGVSDLRPVATTATLGAMFDRGGKLRLTVGILLSYTDSAIDDGADGVSIALRVVKK